MTNEITVIKVDGTKEQHNSQTFEVHPIANDTMGMWAFNVVDEAAEIPLDNSVISKVLGKIINNEPASV